MLLGETKMHTSVNDVEQRTQNGGKTHFLVHQGRMCKEKQLQQLEISRKFHSVLNKQQD